MYFWVVSACGDALFQHRIGGTTVEDYLPLRLFFVAQVKEVMQIQIKEVRWYECFHRSISWAFFRSVS